MKVCSAILLLIAAAVCNVEQASALRGNGMRASDLHRTERITRRRKLKKGTSGKEPYEIVAEHEGGLFGAVKKVAKKAKDKQEAVAAAAIAANITTSNATSVPTAVPVNETLPRDLPMFSLQFHTTSDYNPADDLSNYDELEMYLGQYLGDRMDEVFMDTPGEHLFTEVYIDETADPFIVDVYATANFRIPGQVPTHEYLVQQTKEALTVQEDPDEYVNDFDYLIESVRSMNTTNPFHKTVDIVYEPWAKKNPANSSSHSSYWASVFSLLGITAFLSLAIVISYAFKKHRESRFLLHDDPLQLHVVESRSGINGMSYNDEESLRHVDAVRKQYSDSNNLPQISFLEDPQDPQLEPAGSYEAPIFIGYKDEVVEEEDEEEKSVSEGSDEYTEQIVEDEGESIDEEVDDETIEEEFTDEPQEPKESNLGRFERLLGNLRNNESDDDETVEEEIIEDEDEEEESQSSYDEQTVESGDLLGLSTVPVQLRSESSRPLDPPQEEPQVATKDLFSMWENNGNKRTIAPVASLNEDEDESESPAEAPSADPPAQKSGLFSFWAIKAGESKDDDESAEEEVVTETEEEQAKEESNDDELEHTLV
ncbi:unnamed protein product [Cylindrotheca closterium]|uniref:Uncharacterized protein n=1 Tax=Cylindrotheca closterium TaxID=2856 RepID=A0AAD2FHQ9_9STRA|nr:unnamed protein product [Cylindrotheca closterium]